MKLLVKINNSEISHRLKLNYNNVYSRLKMILGQQASLFADVSMKSTTTSWYSDDDAEYNRLSEANKSEITRLNSALNRIVIGVKKELDSASELSVYADDIMEIPDNSFVFYRPVADGYKFILAGWGCKFAHQSSTDPSSGFIKRISKPLEMDDPGGNPAATTGGTSEPLSGWSEPEVKTDDEPAKDVPSDPSEPSKPRREEEKKNDEVIKRKLFDKKTQHVKVRVLDQNNNPVAGELVRVRTSAEEFQNRTLDNGEVEIGQLAYGDNFGIVFPNIQGNQERGFEVEPNVEVYEAYIKKLRKYSPVLFIEDQDGNAVVDYNVKVIIGGRDSIYNSGGDGVVQLPSMQEGQKFTVIDSANYANSEEYSVTQADAKTPYHFHIMRTEKSKVGITVLDKVGNPIPNAMVDLTVDDLRCNQATKEDGRVEFPYEVFKAGVIPVILNVKGKGKIKSDLSFTPDITEYTIQLQDTKIVKPMKLNWKWLALIPILCLLAWGGYELHKSLPWGVTPIDQMKTGVVLIHSRCLYYVETGLTMSNGQPQRFYFDYDQNSGEVTAVSFEESDIPWFIEKCSGTGTGFLISEDGLIATNRHVADPVPPQEKTQLIKQIIHNTKTRLEGLKDSLDNELTTIGPLSQMDEQYHTQYELLKNQKQMILNNIREWDRILTVGEFKVKVECETSVAFLNSIIDRWDDFVGCSLRASGNPAGVNEKDVAIIQLKNKERDVPKNAYIFKVPEKDLMDEKIPDDYEVTVLGYNEGIGLADIQNGITPQTQTGKVTQTNEKYRIGYNAPTAGGSSGAPVINKKHQLVAVNNSGLSRQGFNYGVRTKYLKELLDEVQNKSKDEK